MAIFHWFKREFVKRLLLIMGLAIAIPITLLIVSVIWGEYFNILCPIAICILIAFFATLIACSGDDKKKVKIYTW